MREENRSMRVFSALGIIFILAGHLNMNVFELGGLFPYYSFHVYVFLFVSGYFYSIQSEEHPVKYILYKAKRLLIPYFCFNLFYGIVSTICIKNGLYYGGDISLYNLFVAPFHGGHQFMFNAPSWFLIALFEVEVVNILMRKVLKTIKLEYDFLIFVLVMLAGIATVYLAIGGHVWGWYKDIGRILIMLPGFYFGVIYKKYVDKLIPKEGNMSYAIPVGMVLVSVICQSVLVKSCGGLAFSTVWVSSFANNAVIPFVTVLTGIMFWLSVAMLVTKLLALNKITAKVIDALVVIGRNTMGIMLHHLFVFFLFNLSLYQMSQKWNILKEFDVEVFRTDIYYAYGTNEIKLVYLVLGVVIPVLIYEVVRKCRKGMK